MAFAYVSETNAVNSASGTTLSTPSYANTAGNHLFVHVVYSATGTTTATVMDTAGNTFTPLSRVQADTQPLWGQWFYCLNATGNAANVFTVTLGAARSNRLIRVFEFSCAGAALDQDRTPVTTGGLLSSTISDGPFNTPADGLILAGEVNWNSDTSTNFGAGYTGMSSLQPYSKQGYRVTSGALTGETTTYTGAVSTYRGLAVASFITAAAGQTISPSPASIAITGNAPLVAHAANLSPSGASVTITGYAPVVSQQPATITPGTASITLSAFVPTVSQGSQAAHPAGDGGGAGNVREVRRFADLLDKAHKLTRSQKKKRRAEIVEQVREALPPLPEAEQIAPAIARIVYEQEAKARAMYADRPIEALAPVVVPFDAHAAIAALVDQWMADEAMRREIEEENEVDEFLLLGA